MKQTAKKIQVEMVHNRGYTIPKEEIWMLDQERKMKQAYNQTYTNDDNILYVHYLNEDLIDDMKIFKKKMKNCTHGMIIGENDDIKKVSTKYNDYFNPLKKYQLFTIEELQSNITESILNGTFEKVSSSLIIPSIAHANELPFFMLNDPIVKYYDFNAGDVIKITEDSDVDLFENKKISYAIVKNITYKYYNINK